MGKFLRIVLIVIVALVVIFAAFILIAPRLERTSAPVAGDMDGDVLVLEGAAFSSPDTSPEQSVTVTPENNLHITVLPNQPPPTPAERGVRVVLTPESAALIDNKPVTIEVSYAPLATGAASGLAISLQGIGPAEWVSQPIGAAPGVARFDLPAQFTANAVGLRALSETAGQGGGLEITRIRIIPAPPAAEIPLPPAEPPAP